jgi:ABC-type uncharacterized transport system YnjBCD ATPase subunit
MLSKAKLATLDEGMSSLDSYTALWAKGKNNEAGKELVKARTSAVGASSAANATELRTALETMQAGQRAELAALETRVAEVRKAMVQRRFIVLDARLDKGDRAMLAAREKTVELNSIISLPLSIFGFR